jgi:EAL domain-containing protein (putative c-di-GMP-specific phosphodiesterase class I)
MLTADVSAAARQRVLAAGAKDFLTKPFDPVEVLFRVRNMLETAYLYRAVCSRNTDLQAIIAEKTVDEVASAAARRSQAERVDRVFAEPEQLTMVFQPILDISSARVVGVESLARFAGDPPRPPDEWFSEAAAVGRGTELELMAVTAALSQLSRLPPGLYMSVNASPATAMSPELAACTAVDPRRVVVELTEHVSFEAYPTLVDRLDDLRSGGVRISVDDAGSGYAGLSSLLALGPDMVKLDRYLIAGITQDPCRRALASAFVAFCADIGASLIAEGIESAEELAILVRLGVPCGQGFHLGRPQPLPLPNAPT